MYTKEEEIIHFVFMAFHGMQRKKEDIESSFHSIMVGNMLKNIGCNEDTIYIGYLHDIIEDTKYSYDDLLKKYGPKIANGVLELTENQNIKDYVERKKHFIMQLKKSSNEIIIVEIADKLQNLISDYSQFLKNGKNSLITECNNFEELKWFYLNLQTLFNERINNNKLLDRYNEIIKIYFK
jgi:(p)ppGpp synthase/HD superfamily hydrolase